MSSQRAVEGRVALVTGAAGGIGRAVVEALAEAGATVVGVDVREPAPPIPKPARAERADVAKGADVDALFARLHRDRALPDALVLCHGLGVHERLDEGDPETWARVLDANVMGVLRVLRAFLPPLVQAGGDVVLLGSLAAERPHAYGGPYAASKAAVHAVADALRLEVAPRARVTTVVPGIVDTPFFARTPGHPGDLAAVGMGALAPARVADAVLFALRQPEGASVARVVVHPGGQPA